MIPLRDDVPPRRPAVVVKVLLLANAVGFILQLLFAPEFTARFALVPADAIAAAEGDADLLAGLFPLLSSQFLHGGLLHLGSNLLFLWIFADNVEGEWGPRRFLALYLLCGVIAAGTHILLVGADSTPLIGASGAIAGTLGAYSVFFPHARILTLVPIGVIPLFFEIPALVFLLLWFGSQVLLGLLEAGGNVAVWAHAGGFAAGAALAGLTRRPPGRHGPRPRYSSPGAPARSVRFERHSR